MHLNVQVCEEKERCDIVGKLRAELAAAKAENERLSKRINHLRDRMDDIRHPDSDEMSMRVIAASSLELDDTAAARKDGDG